MKDRKLLMIPGPIEFSPSVLAAMSLPTTSHVAPDFIETFGRALDGLCDVFLAKKSMPFVVAGSGTLAMDMAAANVVEPGDGALVINTGYFSDRFAAILRRYGATVTEVKAPSLGDAPSIEAVRSAIESSKCKLITITHVDTSTGVRAPVADYANAARKQGALVVVDGVCSIGGEELRQDEWGIDIALTASQKAIGVPPGLALLAASERALEKHKSRKTPVQNYYCDWAEWRPIMEAYRARKPGYFGTPPVNLVGSLAVSIGEILNEGMDKRVQRHRHLSNAFKAGISALGLKQLPQHRDLQAATLTAAYYPGGSENGLLKEILSEGVIVAGGLHPEIKTKYFRIGHMGAVTRSDILATLGAIERSLIRTGHKATPGSASAAAEKVFAGS